MRLLAASSDGGSVSSTCCPQAATSLQCRTRADEQLACSRKSCLWQSFDGATSACIGVRPVRRSSVAFALLATAAGLAGCHSHEGIHGNPPGLTLLPAGSPGKCLDGTPGGYYLSLATEELSKRKWVIRLEGGGECASAWRCGLKSGEALGSSKWFPQHGQMEYLTSRDPDENPLASTWNHVFIMYCSQDLWSGTRTEATAETWDLYFAGHSIFKEVILQLNSTQDLQSATEVILTGESAGGIGAWLNQGWLQAVLPPTTRFVLVPIAGFYGFAHKYTGPGHVSGSLVDFSEASWPQLVKLWGSHVDANCAAALGDHWWACMLSNYSRPHIATPAFVVEAQTDAVQLTDHDDIPKPNEWSDPIRSYVEEWQLNMSNALHNVLLPSDGFFFPACFTHIGFSKAAPLLRMQIPGDTASMVSYGRALAAWYNKEQAFVHLEDTCGIRCGSCPAEPTLQRSHVESSEPFAHAEELLV